MRDLRQRVGLIHELRQLVGTKERVDHRRQGLGIDQIDRGKHLVVSNVHTLTNGSGHTGQTNTELRTQLLTNSTNTTVGQVIDIIDLCFRVDQLDQVFYYGNDIFLGQDLLVHLDIKTQFLIHSVTSYLTQVISLVGEEQFVDDTASSFLIGRLRITQLTINVLYRFFFRVGRVLLQGIVNNGIVCLQVILLVKKNSRRTRIEDLLDMLFFQNSITIQNDLVPLDRYYLTSIFINEIFVPGLQDTGSQFASHEFLKSCLGSLDLFGQVENLEDIFITLKSDGSEKGSYR